MSEQELLSQWKSRLEPYAHNYNVFSGKDNHDTIYASIRVNGKYYESHISFFEKWYCIGAEKAEEGWSDCLDYNDPSDFEKAMQKVLDYLDLKPQAVQMRLF